MTFNDWVSYYLTPNNIILILVLFIIILATIIIFMVLNNLKENKTEEKGINKFNLQEVTNNLEENMDKERFISVSEYENEQEKKAIISYDELLKNASSLTINYDDETSIDGVKVKKVDIEKDESKNIKQETLEVKNKGFYSYEREEEFLKALKQFRAKL